MALVAYGSSGESSDSEDDSGSSMSVNGGKTSFSPEKSANQLPKPEVRRGTAADFISDDEEDEIRTHNTNGHFIGD